MQPESNLTQKTYCLSALLAYISCLLQLDESAELDSSVGTTKDVFEELLSHQLLLQMYGSISEVSLLIAGRSPVSWWPPDSLPTRGSASGVTGLGVGSATASGAQSPTRAAAAAAGGDHSGGAQQHDGGIAIAAAAVDALAASTQASRPAAGGTGIGSGSGSSSSSRLLVCLEEEVNLAAIKFQGAQVGVTVSGDGFSTEVAMAALTIDDLLVGAKNAGKAHMARSSIVWEQKQAQTGKEQEDKGPAAEGRLGQALAVVAARTQ